MQLTVAKKLGDKSDYLPLTIIGTTLLLSLYIFYNVIIKGHGHFHPINISSEWIATSALSVSLGIYVDSITSIMLCVVSLISFLVHLYSTEYMKGDKRYLRYFAFLGLFTFSMNGIVFETKSYKIAQTDSVCNFHLCRLLKHCATTDIYVD